MPKCIICGKENFNANDTCSSKCWIKALQKDKKEIWHGNKQLSILNYT